MYNKKYDIVLFGATGFAGQLTAKYLAAHAIKEELTFAIAGRSSAKLDALTQELKQETGISVDSILADVQDEQSLIEMCLSTHILMSSAGPYVLYGEPVLNACIQAKTHYLDITGEPDFVFKMRNLYSGAIVEAGISCIHCCGFDSIPADLGTYLTVQKLPKADEKRIKVYVSTNATFSSGTIRSAILAISGKFRYRDTLEPGSLSPKPLKMKRGIHYQREIKRWCIPMPVIDAHIVRQSAAGNEEMYGNSFGYAQFFTFPGFASMMKMLSLLIIGALFLRIGAIRKLVFRRFESGSGPSEEKRAKSTFMLDFFGEAAGEKIHTSISGKDPGYDETAKMFSESAFCLSDRIRTNDVEPGVLSPARAFGTNLHKRLKDAGMVFKGI